MVSLSNLDFSRFTPRAFFKIHKAVFTRWCWHRPPPCPGAWGKIWLFCPLRGSRWAAPQMGFFLNETLTAMLASSQSTPTLTPTCSSGSSLLPWVTKSTSSQLDFLQVPLWFTFYSSPFHQFEATDAPVVLWLQVTFWLSHYQLNLLIIFLTNKFEQLPSKKQKAEKIA